MHDFVQYATNIEAVGRNMLIENLKTFIHRKYTVDIDRIQICTKDKNRTIIRNIHYNMAVARFLTTTL